MLLAIPRQPQNRRRIPPLFDHDLGCCCCYCSTCGRCHTFLDVRAKRLLTAQVRSAACCDCIRYCTRHAYQARGPHQKTGALSSPRNVVRATSNAQNRTYNPPPAYSLVYVCVCVYSEPSVESRAFACAYRVHFGTAININYAK